MQFDTVSQTTVMRRRADVVRGRVVSVDTGIIRTLSSITLEVLSKL